MLNSFDLFNCSGQMVEHWVRGKNCPLNASVNIIVLTLEILDSSHNCFNILKITLILL